MIFKKNQQIQSRNDALESDDVSKKTKNLIPFFKAVTGDDVEKKTAEIQFRNDALESGDVSKNLKKPIPLYKAVKSDDVEKKPQKIRFRDDALASDDVSKTKNLISLFKALTSVDVKKTRRKSNSETMCLQAMLFQKKTKNLIPFSEL